MRARQAPNGYYSQEAPPDICLVCDETVEADHFTRRMQPKARLGYTWMCKERVRKYHREHYARVMAHPDQALNRKNSDQARYLKDPRYVCFKAYVGEDRRKGRYNDLTWEIAHDLMNQSCHYCLGEGGGLDRIDSMLGHSADNVVPCCSQCNNILGDIPPEMKEALRPGLQECRERGLFGDWIPPTMRNRTNRVSQF